MAAGFETAFDTDPLFGASTSNKCPSPMLSGTIQDKTRFGSGKMLADAFLSDFERRRANSASTRSRSRASSSASALKKLHKAMHRRRMDSGSSAGSRRVKGLGGFNDRAFDLFDNFQGLDGNDFNMLDDGINLLGNDEVRSSRSKRSRASSKLYDDFVLNGFGSRTRHRSGSTSEVGRRSRLISGVSDVFDELLFSGDLNLQQAAEQLLHTLEEIPSESSEGRPGTPEAPAPLPGPAMFCTGCGCECKLDEGKWRCTSKFCRKINESPSCTELKKSCGLSTSTSASAATSSSGALLKEEQRFTNHSNAGGQLSDVKQGRRSNSSEVKNGDRSDRTRPSSSNSKSALNLRNRRQATSPLRKKTRNEDSSICLNSSSSKEPKKMGALTPPRELSLFSTASSQKIPSGAVQNNVDPKRHVRSTGRPRQYKVEKTPVMGPNGQRQCTFCNGQVRPQMCGSNKHRWRCVDKKCRKWYGWVKSHEEIPRDLGKKGRWNHAARTKKPVVTTKKSKEEDDTGPASLSSQAEAALAAAEILSMRSDGTTDPVSFVIQQNVQEVKKKLGRPPKEHGLKIRLKGVKEKKDETRQKRKYVRRRDKVAAGTLSSLANQRTEEQEEQRPPPVPLSEAEKNYEPCAIEKRVRWWLSEKRRVDASPERSFDTNVLDSCAAFRMLSHAFRATAVTRADEAQSVNGSLDILMDSLMGSLGPLLTVASAAFESLIPDDLGQMLWNSSAVHLPTFQ